ncbi:hypothetical protein BD413DRAFT_181523 [Trametes elegans]|nr:hypothetical protein BD413DRAFT_181523 [Trametes elegans]
MDDVLTYCNTRPTSAHPSPEIACKRPYQALRILFSCLERDCRRPRLLTRARHALAKQPSTVGSIIQVSLRAGTNRKKQRAAWTGGRSLTDERKMLQTGLWRDVFVADGQVERFTKAAGEAWMVLWIHPASYNALSRALLIEPSDITSLTPNRQLISPQCLRDPLPEQNPPRFGNAAGQTPLMLQTIAYMLQLLRSIRTTLGRKTPSIPKVFGQSFRRAPVASPSSPPPCPASWLSKTNLLSIFHFYKIARRSLVVHDGLLSPSIASVDPVPSSCSRLAGSDIHLEIHVRHPHRNLYRCTSELKPCTLSPRPTLLGKDALLWAQETLTSPGRHSHKGPTHCS